MYSLLRYSIRNVTFRRQLRRLVRCTCWFSNVNTIRDCSLFTCCDAWKEALDDTRFLELLWAGLTRARTVADAAMIERYLIKVLRRRQARS